MKRLSSAAVLLLIPSALAAANPPPPIIDMHLHALALAPFASLMGPPPIPHCVPMTDYPVPDTAAAWSDVFTRRDLPCRATLSPMTDDEVMEKTLASMKRRNIFGVTSGGLVDRYMKAGPDRIIPSLSFPGGSDAPSVEAVRTSLTEGNFKVLGEVTARPGTGRPHPRAVLSPGGGTRCSCRHPRRHRASRRAVPGLRSLPRTPPQPPRAGGTIRPGRGAGTSNSRC